MLSDVSNGFESDSIANSFAKSSKTFKNDSPLVKKGEAGYIPDMDIDNDGIVTHDEFKQYCDEKQMGLKERLELMELIQTAKALNKNADDSESDKKNENQIIYAREGEESYDKNMDLNRDGKVTYEEYLRYCEKQRQTSNSKNPYSKLQDVSQDEEISKIKIEVDV